MRNRTRNKFGLQVGFTVEYFHGPGKSNRFIYCLLIFEHRSHFKLKDRRMRNVENMRKNKRGLKRSASSFTKSDWTNFAS